MARKPLSVDDKKLKKWLKKCETGAPQALKECLKENTQACYALAVQLAPIDTGRLRLSIHYEMLNGGTVGKVATGVEYARYVEQGTMYQAAQPFMKPAYFAVLKNLKPQLEKVLKDFLNDAHY